MNDLCAEKKVCVQPVQVIRVRFNLVVVLPNKGQNINKAYP